MRRTPYLSLLGSIHLTLALATGCGGSTGGPGDTCADLDDCGSGLMCNASGTCEQGVECADNTACSDGTVCSARGICVGNTIDGPCTGTPNCVDGQECSTEGVCVDESCGGQLFQADAIPPNVLIVLDRSGSMVSNRIDGRTRWDIAKEAVDLVTTNFESQLRFGLALFPGGAQDCPNSPECLAGTVHRDPVVDARDDITGFLNNATTCQLSTPIAGTFDVLAGYSGLEDTTRGNYVLLISDGEDTCPGDPVTAVAALRDLDPEVETFVVGFGLGAAGSDQLDDMATAGGTARPGSPKYYQAESADQLQSALAAIAGSVVSCDFALAQTPPNADELSVFFNNSRVSRDDPDGWSYDSAGNRLVFTGAACAQLQSGSVTDLKVIFGCPDDIVVVE